MGGGGNVFAGHGVYCGAVAGFVGLSWSAHAGLISFLLVGFSFSGFLGPSFFFLFLSLSFH